MNEINTDYKKIIERAINRSTRVENSPSNSFSELNYYDEHNNVIVCKKTYENNGISYDISENDYDEFGNIVVISHATIVEDKLYAYESKTFYEYIYNEHNQVLERKTYNNEHNLYEIIKNYYHTNKLIKSEEYNNRNLDAPAYIDIMRNDFDVPFHIHTYTYGSEGNLIEEKICLKSGDVSCFIKYNEKGIKEKIVNPFKTVYSWIIDSIDNGFFEVTMKENTFDYKMLTDVVDSICSHYSKCNCIYLNSQNAKGNVFDYEKIRELVQLYEKNRNITFYLF